MKKSLLQGLLGENVLGPMMKLPGGISIGGMSIGGMAGELGLGPKKPAPPSSASTSSAPALAYRPEEKAAAPAPPLLGQVFKESNKDSSAPPPATPTKPLVDDHVHDVEPTAPPPPPPAPLLSQSYYSTQYVTNDNVVTKILWEETFVTVIEDGDSPAATAPAVGHKHRRHVAHHAHGHAKF